MGVERLAAIESAKLVIREPTKYIGLVVGLYSLSLKDCELGKAAKSYYLFLRHIDDYLDETQDKPEKLSYVLNIRGQIESREFTGEPKIAELAKFSLEVLERKASPNDNPRLDFLTIVDAMVFDYERSKSRSVLSNEELNNYYHDTFFSVVNLALMGLNSKFRARDIPTLSYCQGRVFSVRDLDEDWQRGVINIPKEILEKAQLTQYSSIDEVKANGIVGKWLRDQLLQSKTELTDLKAQLLESGEKVTSMLCNGVTKTASKLIIDYR